MASQNYFTMITLGAHFERTYFFPRSEPITQQTLECSPGYLPSAVVLCRRMLESWTTSASIGMRPKAFSG
jgi:hypothetical protein